MPHDDLTARLKTVPGMAEVEERQGVVWASGPALDVAAMAREMSALGIRLATITALPETEHGETAVVYHYVGAAGFINVRTRTRNGALPSLAGIHRPAAWAEREIKDLFGVTFAGHPNLVPLLRPAAHAEGLFRAPMCARLAGKS